MAIKTDHELFLLKTSFYLINKLGGFIKKANKSAEPILITLRFGRKKIGSLRISPNSAKLILKNFKLGEINKLIPLMIPENIIGGYSKESAFIIRSVGISFEITEPKLIELTAEKI